MTSGPGASNDDTVNPPHEPAAELPRGWRAVGKGAETVRSVDDAADAADDAVRFAGDEDDVLTTAPAQHEDTSGNLSLSNAALLGIGIFAGVYLLYTIGWFVGAERISPVAPVLLGGEAHFQILKWLAIAAPFIWFVTTFVLTRHSKAWKRFAWLIAGALLLVPWPMFANLTSGVTL